MSPHYSMAIVNASLSLVVLLGVIFYRYVFPKKHINLFILLIIISILPITSVFRDGVYESGDFNLHIYREMAFFTALLDKQFMPSWAGPLNATYGYPLFIFLNPLPYYIISFFHFIGFSFVMSMKIFLVSCYLTSGIFMYLFSRKLFKNDFAAFTSAIFYQFAPYHFVDLHFRVDVGEILFFSTFPLFLFILISLFQKHTKKTVLAAGVTLSLLFLSHQAMAIFSLVILVPFTLFYFFSLQMKRLHTGFAIILTIVIGLVLSAYAWLPHLTHTKYTYGYLLEKSVVGFLTVQDLLYSPWRSGFLFQSSMGHLSYLIGYTQLFIVLSFMFLVVKNRVFKNIKRAVFLWLGVFCLLLFLMIPVSSFFWKTFPLLNFAQFTSRFLLFMAFTTAILAGYLSTCFKKKYFVTILIIITIGYTILNWGNRRTIPTIADPTLQEELPMSTLAGEALCCFGSPKWVTYNDFWMKKIPAAHIEILAGNGKIREVSRNSVHHRYIVNAENSLYVVENTIFFPGWIATIDGKAITLDYEKPQLRGIIHFVIPKGLHVVEISYHDLPFHLFAKSISMVGYGAYVCFLFYLIIQFISIQRIRRFVWRRI